MKVRITKPLKTILICLLLLLAWTAPAAADALAVKSNQPIYVDNIFVEITMYNINGNNYTRLRDIGQAVGFNVIYDANTKAIHLKTDEAYSGEVSAIGQQPDTVQVQQTIQTLYIDGSQTYITAYNIGGNNYVKLIDLGAAVGFDVLWDSSNNRVLVKALRPYIEQAQPPDPIPEIPENPAMTIEEMKAEIIRLTNEARVEAGLSELEVLPALMDCAQAKAQDMVDNSYLSHTSPINGDFAKPIRAAIPQAGILGENAKSLLSWDETVKEAFETWMYSEGHRANILNPVFTHIGVGVAIDENGNEKWVQHFAQMP